MSTFLDNDKTKPGLSQCVNGMLQLRNGRELLEVGIPILQTMITGDGSQDSHFARMVTEGLYPDNATAHSSWDEINSLFSKVSGDGDVSFVHAATNQCCAKHGV